MHISMRGSHGNQPEMMRNRVAMVQKEVHECSYISRVIRPELSNYIYIQGMEKLPP